MHIIKAPPRARRALRLLAVAGLLGLTGAALTGVTPASAGPLYVSSVTSTDFFGHQSNQSAEAWTSEPVRLSVSANANVGGDTLEIVNADNPNTPLVSCSQAQTCPSVTVNFSTTGQRLFIGELVAGGQVVSQYFDYVTWEDFPVSLQVSQTTVPVGTAVALTATTSRPVDYSPWYIQIYDLTTGARVCEVGSSGTCPTTVTQNVATTQEYAAFVGNYAPTFAQLTEIRSQSPDWFVTWSNDGWQVSLTAPATTFDTATVTATANMSVTPTQFYIEIFDETTGQRLTECPFNAVCPYTFQPSTAGDTLVAFVSLLDSNLPPSGIEASSNVVNTQLLLQ